jgi:hypothetical protein
MGTFAETAIIEYRFLFADPRKTNFRFPFSFAANRRKFAVSVFYLQQNKRELPFFVNSVFRMYIYIYAAVSIYVLLIYTEMKLYICGSKRDKRYDSTGY